jgi:AcrR family transcriptional regulator
VGASSEVARPTAVRPDRRAARHQETKDQILAAAWELVREQGLAGLAMRDIGERVGMKAQSIYVYFASKHEIFDGMFREGYLAFGAAMADALAVPHDAAHADAADAARATARLVAHRFFEFCTSDPVRYQLLFQRTIPDFVPSADTYAVALDAYEAMRAQMAAFGVREPEAIDLWTATLTGLTDQQISNDPGGKRWERIIDRAVDMVLRETAPHLFAPIAESERP